MGRIADYIYPEDNENGKESIVVDASDGTPYEFYSEDLRKIERI